MSSAADNFISKIATLTEADFVSATITPLETLKENAPVRMRCKMELFVTYLQAMVIKKLQSYEPGQTFRVDLWKREQGGGGISSVLQDGDVFEKAGVNISVVWGTLNPEQVKTMRSRGKNIEEGNSDFFATGISCVLHPKNPFVPSLHFNYRYFEVMNANGGEGGVNDTWWFGGGCDMTPNYLNEQDAIHFHSEQKKACDLNDPGYYPEFKKWADDYFYIPFRGECRGVGGIFFDDLDRKPIDECFAFLVTCGYSILPSYTPIVDTHKDDEYEERHDRWKKLRRGRYVEFNLVYDRGTKFGLMTPGSRIESILMSLPLIARWEYMVEVVEGTEEEKMMEVLKKPRDWV